MKEAAAGERFEEAARLPQPPPRDRASRRAAGGRPARRRRRRRDRDRRRRRRRGRPDLPAARRQADRPPRLPSRERRRAGHVRRSSRPSASSTTGRRRASRRRSSSRATPATSRRSRSSSPSGGARASRCARRRAARSGGSQSWPTQNAQLALESETAAARAAARAAGRGARGAARGAQPREPAAADRVLRHLEHPGAGDRRLDGRLPGRDAEEGALPQVRACAGSTGRTTSPRWRRSSRAASPGSPRDRARSSTTSASPPSPNLVVIDGGKGQLSAALEAMQAHDLPRVAVIALAKRIEEVFVPGRSQPILLDRAQPGAPAAAAHPRRGPPLRGRLPPPAARDASRSARSSTRSPGVGPARRRALLAHFGSAERFLAASQEELEGVPGLPPKTARAVYAQLHKTGGA